MEHQNFVIQHSPEEIPQETRADLQECAEEALEILGCQDSMTPQQIIDQIEIFVQRWQLGKRPKIGLDEEDALLLLASLWGEQIVASYSWKWIWVSCKENGEEFKSLAVSTPNHSLVIYPVVYLDNCFEEREFPVGISRSFQKLAEIGTESSIPANSLIDFMEE